MTVAATNRSKILRMWLCTSMWWCHMTSSLITQTWWPFGLIPNGQKGEDGNARNTHCWKKGVCLCCQLIIN